jgi:hypothetical protein
MSYFFHSLEQKKKIYYCRNFPLLFYSTFPVRKTLYISKESVVNKKEKSIVNEEGEEVLRTFYIIIIIIIDIFPPSTLFIYQVYTSNVLNLSYCHYHHQQLVVVVRTRRENEYMRERKKSQ